MRAGTDRRRHARKRRLPVPRRPCRSSEGTDRDEGMRDGGVLRRSSGFSRWAGLGRMGGRLAPLWRGIDQLLLQHRLEEHTSELQSLMSISYAVFCLKKQMHKSFI